MKLTKVLMALAGTAMFVACAEEELVKVENSSQQTMEEVVGANLVGTGISINAYMGNSDSQTRYADGNNGWGEGDVVGLAWLLAGKSSVGDTQDPAKKPETSYVYANHMFDTEDSGNTWSTKGNVYEGWYYAYYPWNYVNKPGSPIYYVLNPDMKGAGVPLHQSQSLYVSNNQFISVADLDHETNTVDKSFKMHQAVKFIQVTATPQAGSPFEKGKDLSNLDITSIKISADQNVFTTEAVLYGKSLPVNVDYPENATAEQKKEVDIQNLKNFRAAYSSVVVSSKKSNSIERNVAKAGVKVSTNDGKQKNVNFYMNVLPAKLTLDEENITIEVTTSASKFVIKYADTPSEANKKAIEDFVAAFAKDGNLSTILDVDAEGNPANLKNLKLAIELCGEDYTTDFSAINSYDTWAAAVKEVEVLGLQNEEFTITGDIEFADGKVLMPTNGAKITVVTSDKDPKQIVLKSGTFEGVPANLNVEAVAVKVEKAATVTNAHTIKAAEVHNYGKLEVPAYTGEQDPFNPEFNTLSNVINYNNEVGSIRLLGNYAKVANVNNEAGRIDLVYGSFVELAESTDAGIIAYNVLKDDTPKMIETIIGTNNDNGNALVNVLVLDSENGFTTFDFTKKTEATGGSNDPYNPEQGNDETYDVLVDGLENISLEIKGVDVCSSKKSVTVNNVTVNDADILSGITIGGNLTVEGGAVVVSTPDIVGDLLVKAGNGTITSADGIKSVTIENGNYTVNAETIEGAVVATGENYFNVSVFNGAVTMTNTSSSNVIAIDGAAFESNVTLTGTYGLVNTTVKGDLTINGGTENAPVKLLNVEVKGNLTVKGGYVVANNVNVTGDLTVEAGTYVNNAEGDTNIANIVVKSGATLNANNDVYVETIAVYGTVKVATGKTIWYTVPTTQGGYIQEGTTTGRVKSTNEYAETVAYNLKNGKDVTLETDIELTEPISISKDVTVDLNGKTLTSTVAAFEVTAGTLTITGNGVVEAVTSHVNKAGIWAMGGNIVIKNGDFSVGEDENGTINPCVYVGSQGGFITIDGGTFTHVGTPDNGTAIINVQNTVTPDKGKIIINAAEIVVPAGGSVAYEDADVQKGVIVDNRKN